MDLSNPGRQEGQVSENLPVALAKENKRCMTLHCTAEIFSLSLSCKQCKANTAVSYEMFAVHSVESASSFPWPIYESD